MKHRNFNSKLLKMGNYSKLLFRSASRRQDSEGLGHFYEGSKLARKVAKRKAPMQATYGSDGMSYNKTIYGRHPCSPCLQTLAPSQGGVWLCILCTTIFPASLQLFLPAASTCVTVRKSLKSGQQQSIPLTNRSFTASWIEILLSGSG